MKKITLFLALMTTGFFGGQIYGAQRHDIDLLSLPVGALDELTTKYCLTPIQTSTNPGPISSPAPSSSISTSPTSSILHGCDINELNELTNKMITQEKRTNKQLTKEQAEAAINQALNFEECLRNYKNALANKKAAKQAYRCAIKRIIKQGNKRLEYAISIIKSFDMDVKRITQKTNKQLTKEQAEATGN